MRTNVPLAMRSLRSQRRWRQRDLATRAGLSRDAVSRAERGQLAGLTIGSVSRLVTALEATLVLEMRWQGADLDRLVDERHARLQEVTARRMTACGWLVQVEVSFNHFGDRGSCDVVGWHPATRTMLIVEIKTRLGNIQDTLHRLDVKARLGTFIARELDWPQPAAVARGLVLAEDRTTRRVVARHETLFAQFRCRGWAARRWIRSPRADETALLWFESLPDSAESGTKAVDRVRLSRPQGEMHT